MKQLDFKMIDRFVQHLADVNEIIILSYGMGVESTAILLRWLTEPDTFPYKLNNLIVITSQVGNEWPDTAKDVEIYILPLLRKHKIRFVQVARHGHYQSDGITVLEDSCNPTRCYIEGDYKLSDELRLNGVVPQFGGTHRCSLKFKAFVIETWLDKHIREPARHVFGYNVDEQNRVAKSISRFKERIAFEFNVNESSRVSHSMRYNSSNRIGWYPLIEWNWNRQDCFDYIKSVLNIEWKKSACYFCPFSHNKQSLLSLIARQKKYPDQTSEAMMLEHMSLSLNPRGTLYSKSSLIDHVKSTNNIVALENYKQQLERLPWALYRVRRIYKKKGSADRAVEKLFVFDNKADAESSLATIPGHVSTHRDIMYVYRQHKNCIYPTQEDFTVTAPALVETKTRYGINDFNKKWTHVENKDMLVD